MSPIEDAARAYVGARITAANSSGPDQLQAVIELDRCWHDLQAIVLDDCTMCDPGTCPSSGQHAPQALP